MTELDRETRCKILTRMKTPDMKVRRIGLDLSSRKRSSSRIEDPLGVGDQEVAGQGNGAIFAPAAVLDIAFGQNLGEDPLVHGELGQGEFELVHVAVVTDLLGSRDGFHPGRAIVLNERRRIRVPPMAVGDDVRKDPSVTGKVLGS
jgi:hypothetical protein